MISIAKTASINIGTLSMKFLSTEVVLYLQKSTRWSWNIIVMFGLVLLAPTWNR